MSYDAYEPQPKKDVLLTTEEVEQLKKEALRHDVPEDSFRNKLAKLDALRDYLK